jgi:hypothetical protein
MTMTYQNIQYQTIWITESQPLPPHGVGCWDWFYSYEECLKQFNEELADNGVTGFDSHEIGLYSVHLPADWNQDQIQYWCEDNINCLPLYIETIAPAAAGE